MNVKIETVQFMADLKLLDKIFQSIWGRLFIAALQTLLSSVVLSFIFLARQSGDITLLKYTVVLAVGFIAGFSARRFLKGHTQTLKSAGALVSVVLSLAVLFTLSGGFLGINLFTQFNKTPDWFGLIQIGLASFGAWLVIQAFRSPPWLKDISAPVIPSRKTRVQTNPGINRWLPKLSLHSGKKIIQKPSGIISEKKEPLSVGKSTPKKEAPPLAIAKAKSPTKVSPAHKLSLAPASKPTTKKPARLKKNRSKKISANAKDIKFIGVEEHSCPYCLDPVKPHDPRGVKICPVCKTHHHADCWGITGACQIPHSQK